MLYKALEVDIAGSNDKHIFKTSDIYFGKASILFCSGYYDRITYKPQTLITHSCGDWEVQDHGARRFGILT